jgi:hypothetical protein
MPAQRYDLEDRARLHYGRLLWNSERMRPRLLYVWEHPDHPHRERFEENRALVVGLLECEDPQRYVDALPDQAWSLRTLTREIPCMIWTLWDASAEATTPRV